MSRYAQVENGSIITLADFLPKNYKNISRFDLLPADSLKQYGWYTIINKDVNYDSTTHYVSTKRIYYENDNVYSEDIIVEKESSFIQEHQQIELSEEEKQKAFLATRDSFFNELRIQRNNALKQSDWTQVFDLQEIKSNEWKNAWKTYRQQLRDLPEQYINSEITNLSDVIWPIIPQEV